MSAVARNLALFAVMALLFAIVGFIQSWDVSLTLLNMCIISAIMALGVNIQWGYAGSVQCRHDGVCRAWRACGDACFGAAGDRRLAGWRHRAFSARSSRRC